MKALLKNCGLYLLMTFLIVMTSCRNGKTGYLENQMDSLQQVITNQSLLMNEMTTSLDVIAYGLDSIYRQENIIYKGRDEVSGKQLTRSELKQRVDDLVGLIARQRERITALEDSLSFNTSQQMQSLKLIITNLQAQLDEKEQTIENLKAQVANQKVSIAKLQQSKADLEHHVQNQEKALKVQDELVNEGYYIIGTRKQLKEAGVISNNLLQKSKINLETADLTKLKKIDIRTFETELKFNAKKAVVLSHMPETSYKMVQGNGQVILFIEDVASFWSLSKILVIQIR